MKYLLLVIGVVILGGLFFVLKPEPPQSSPDPIDRGHTIQSPLKAFYLVVKANKIVSGPEPIKVDEGDQVAIYITSDVDEEFHLHGYDRSIELEKDKEVLLGFVADKTGRFEFELHNSGTDLGALEVQPK